MKLPSFLPCLSIFLSLLIPYGESGFNPGSGVMLTVPPMGSVGPIHGKLWGLPGPLSQYVVSRVLI